MKTPKIILAGGSGYLGRVLAKAFLAKGWEVVVLTRGQAKAGKARFVQWDGKTMGDWAQELNGAEAVINLTGRSVNCRYTEENRRLILESRVFSTRVIGQAIGLCRQPPKVWLNASTATIYKNSFDKTMDENGEIAGTHDAKDEFSVEVAQAWEKAFGEAVTPQTRKVAFRLAMVFGPEPGTVFRVLRKLVKLGLGGTLAGGKQYVSWIHQEDFVRGIEWLLAHEEFNGAVNLVAPGPVTNQEMMATLRRECGAPFGLPANRWMLEIGAFFMRTETELMLKSRKVVPGRLLKAGFEFQFQEFAGAVRDVENRIKEKSAEV